MEFVTAQLLADRRPGDREHHAEVRLDEDSEPVTSEPIWKDSRRRANAPLPGKARRARPGADASLDDWPPSGLIDRLPDLLTTKMLAPDIVETSVVGLPDKCVDRSHRFVPLDLERVGNDRLHSGSDGERVREDDRGLDGPQFFHLGRTG